MFQSFDKDTTKPINVLESWEKELVLECLRKKPKSLLRAKGLAMLQCGLFRDKQRQKLNCPLIEIKRIFNANK